VSGSEIVLKRNTGTTNQIEFDSNGVVFDLADSPGVKFNNNIHVDGLTNISGSLNVSGSSIIIKPLPTADPGVNGKLFITGSTGMNLGGITGSGTFKILCVSAG